MVESVNESIEMEIDLSQTIIAFLSLLGIWNLREWSAYAASKEVPFVRRHYKHFIYQLRWDAELYVTMENRSIERYTLFLSMTSLSGYDNDEDREIHHKILEWYRSVFSKYCALITSKIGSPEFAGEPVVEGFSDGYMEASMLACWRQRERKILLMVVSEGHDVPVFLKLQSINPEVKVDPMFPIKVCIQQYQNQP